MPIYVALPPDLDCRSFWPRAAGRVSAAISVATSNKKRGGSRPSRSIKMLHPVGPGAALTRGAVAQVAGEWAGLRAGPQDVWP
ncbi:hypothetical protein NBRC116598_26580 [Pseudophaeobacter arcticus]|uniref:Uncharacterized protein n=1 Tax=Pseudophaeobacter arcticus TaxID=385492 RepID=A0ABQ0AN05_9RHOB